MVRCRSNSRHSRPQSKTSEIDPIQTSKPIEIGFRWKLNSVKEIKLKEDWHADRGDWMR